MTDLFSLHLVYKQTDMWLKTEGEPDRQEVETYLKQAYEDIEAYIACDSNFLSSLHPYEVGETAPEIVKVMSEHASKANVGPMAGIAGVIAEYIGRRLSSRHRIILCNNGGDIYYESPEEQWILLNAPGSPFHNQIKICVPSAIKGKGLCTSSGTSGHSVNMGRAYAVSILAGNACSADVWATAMSNQIRSHEDIDRILSLCKEQDDIEGVVILVDNYLGIWGDIRLSRVE